MRVFVVDSNFFIQAHRDTYPLDIAFSFWNKVKQLAENGTIISIDKVKDELYDTNDALEAWCRKNLPHSFFKNTSGFMNEYSRIAAWAVSKSSHYSPKALNEFLDANVADAFIVAYTLADRDNRTIVTQEVSRPEMKRKIKIPEACSAFTIKYCKTMDMFRELGETF
jgi:hypothetical protein